MFLSLDVCPQGVLLDQSNIALFASRSTVFQVGADNLALFAFDFDHPSRRFSGCVLGESNMTPFALDLRLVI